MAYSNTKYTASERHQYYLNNYLDKLQHKINTINVNNKVGFYREIGSLCIKIFGAYYLLKRNKKEILDYKRTSIFVLDELVEMNNFMEICFDKDNRYEQFYILKERMTNTQNKFESFINWFEWITQTDNLLNNINIHIDMWKNDDIEID